MGKSVLLSLGLIVGIAIGFGFGSIMYIDWFGYKASQIEADLCDGYRLRQQESDGFTTRLKCSGTKVGREFPEWLKWAAISPDEKFTLTGMDDLCRPGTKAREIKGKLKCLLYV